MDEWGILLQVANIFLLIIIGLLMRSYLPKYFQEKGKNLATKEDIGDITEKIEAVRAQYARQSHVQKLTSEKEFEILSEVWKTLVDLRQATHGLRPLLDRIDPNESEEERKERRLQKLSESYNALVGVVEKNRPFYSEGIYEALFKIMMIAADEADEYGYRDPYRRPPGPEYWRNALDNQRKILEAVDNVCDLIRERIVA